MNKGIETKAYAAYTPKDSLAPYTFNRRIVGDTDVQVKIAYSGICHSDIHMCRSEWVKHNMYPLVPGHEIVGKVSAVGAKVTKFKVGDLAAVGTMSESCRHCKPCKEFNEQYCEEGATYLFVTPERDGSGLPCQGGYASHIVIDERFTYKLSPSVENDLARVAPLLCAGVTTWSPLKHWKVGKGHKVAIVGLGGLGHMAVKFAVAFGAEVTVLSTSSHKETDARKLGAHHFVCTKDLKVFDTITNNFNFIINTIAVKHDPALYLKALTLDGTLIYLGLPPHEEMLSFHPSYVAAKRKNIAGSQVGGSKETQEMLDYCAQNRIFADIELVSAKDINHAWERTIKGDIKYRFVIDISTI